jgi:hypothetical protein
MFPTQFIPDFFVAEHYGLRITTSWLSKDLASGGFVYELNDVIID